MDNAPNAPAPENAPHQQEPVLPQLPGVRPTEFDFSQILGSALAGLLKHTSSETRFESEHTAQIYREQLGTIERLHRFDATNEQHRFFVYLFVAAVIGASVIGMAGYLIAHEHVQEGTLVLSHAGALIMGLLGGRGLKRAPSRAPEIPGPDFGDDE